MLLTEKQLRYLGQLASTVAHALPGAKNPEVPFFLDDQAVRSYEILRSVWVEYSRRAPSAAHGNSRGTTSIDSRTASSSTAPRRCTADGRGGIRTRSWNVWRSL